MAGMVAKKLGIKEGARAFYVDAPKTAIDAIDPPEMEIAQKLSGEFDYIHFFVKTEASFTEMFPKLKQHLKPKGSLWVSWPKQGKLGTDLKMTNVIKLGYDFGLVESKMIRIDETWTALKFTHPKQGKVYKNSYGKLKA